jgi:hypothetical protein
MLAYQPTSLTTTIIALVFYLLMAGFAIYSLLALYALMRFGRTKILTIIVSVIYLLISGGLYAAAVSYLNAVKF